MKYLLLKLPAINIWLSAGDAGSKISMCRDTIENRGIAWQEDYVPYCIRYKELQLDRDGRKIRRYYEPDVESLLLNPAPRGRKRREMVPDFSGD